MTRLGRLCGICRRRPGALAAAWLPAILLSALPPSVAAARQIGSARAAPVYMDDSPRAVDSLIRAAELAAIGNHDEAVSVIQTLLLEEADRVIATREDPDLFVSVRARAMATIRANPRLLERYRETHSPQADRLLEAGRVEEVERAYLLTAAGHEAALRIAQRQLEDARFAAARLTLLQLEGHPDHTGQRAKAGANMLTTIAAHIGASEPAPERERLRALARADAERWRHLASLGPAAPAEPEPTLAIERTPYAPGDFELDVGELLARPLWTDTLGDAPPLTARVVGARPMNAPPEGATWLYASPTVVGDTVFVNNSETISAWNRFTLAPRWRVKLQNPVGPTITVQQTIEELSTVEAQDGIAVALTGLRVGNSIRTERRILAIDANSGRPLWNRHITDFTSEGFEDAAIRGPLVVTQGLVIFGVEKDVSRRRLESYYLVALDLRTGELQWSRPVGSSGTQNPTNRPSLGDAPLAAGGVVYVASRMGFIGAIEAATGRPVWIRRFVVGYPSNRLPDQPWELNTPVLVGERLYTLSPTRADVLAMDAKTGAILERRSAAEFNSPDYLLYTKGWLLAVGRATVDAVEATDLAEGLIRRAASVNAGGPIRGRVCIVGDHLLVPSLREVHLFSLTEMGKPPVASVTLDRPGATLPLEGQLLVVDDHNIHTYLVWSVADRMLRERMDAAPDNPEPAVTYAELAYRAGRPEIVPSAIDRALAAVERDPLGPDTQAVQARMFRSILQMVDPPPEAPELEPLGDSIRGELITRLGQCASTTEDRVAYLLTAGRHYEGIEQPARAVESYQAVLDDPDLAAASYTSAGTTIGAQFEATRRLRRVIQLHGLGLYETYQADAARLLAELGSEAREPERFEAIARRYPLSRAAVRAWTEAGSRYAAQQRPQLAALAFEEGLTAAQDALDANDPLLGELAGRLVQSLVRAELLHPARAALERLLTERPGLVMTDGGSPLDGRDLLRNIKQRLAQGEPRPRIGPRATAVTPMPGWAIEPPDATDAVALSPSHVLMRSENEEIAMFKAAGLGALTQLWGGLREHIYLWMDRTGVIFSVETGEMNRLDVAFTKRHLDTGEVLWKTPNFRTLHNPGPVDDLLARSPDQPIPEIETPLRARARVTEVMYAYDDRTLVALDRIGRAAGFDLETGATLWVRSDLMSRVHGAAVRSGAVVIGGSDAPIDLRQTNRDSGAQGTSGVVVALDARTGQTLHRAETGGRVRWVRLAPEGPAIVGLDRGVLSIDIFRRTVRWRAESQSVRETTAAWVFPGRTIVRRDDGRLWQIRTSDGAVAFEPLDTRDRLESRFRSIRLTPLGDRAGLATERGLALFGPKGDLQGLDYRETSGAILFGGWGDKYVVTLDSAGESSGDGLYLHDLNVYETDTLRAVSRARITLGAGLETRPMRLIQGKALITTGSITTVIDLPYDDAPGAAPGETSAER